MDIGLSVFMLKIDDIISVDSSQRVRSGFDLVQISQIENSLRQFGQYFKNRLFTRNELDYAQKGDGLCAERLAARFAAKEALIKALNLGEAGIGWREIEVVKCNEGDCELRLHGRVADLAKEIGVVQLVLSLSHDGDYAGAVVVAVVATPSVQKI